MEGMRPESKTYDPKNENELPTAVLSSPVSPQWIELPSDVTANILQRLGVEGILERAQKVCTTWRRVCKDPAMWQVIHITSNRALCRRAVDLSQGQLVDLTIENIGYDDLLHYIVDRSSELKRLTIQYCAMLTRIGLVEAVEKLPHLEELQLIIMPEVQPEDIIIIGESCPSLKSFTFNQNGFWRPSKTYPNFKKRNRNEYALAIAESMPNLCHLRLIANAIDNEGLEEILDCYPKLESIDLRQCFDLNIHGALGKRCSEQIKHLKFPSDSVSHIEYRGATNDQDCVTYYGLDFVAGYI